MLFTFDIISKPKKDTLSFLHTYVHITFLAMLMMLKGSTKIHDFALEESTGIGIMLSKREVEVEKLPRNHPLRSK